MTSIFSKEDIDKQVQDLHVILDITNLMGVERSLDSLLKVLMEGATRVLDADVSSIFLCDYEHNEFFSRYIQQTSVKEIRFPLNKGIAGSVARTRKTINIPDAYQDPRFNPDVDKETNYRTRSILCMPLVSRDEKVIGVTQVLNKRNGVFTAYDEKLLGLFSLQATISIENTLLYEENANLFKSMIRTLSKTIDARDPVTAGHSQRVALYAENLARACRLDATALNEIDVASFLHDVGKIGVRDDVLLKEGRLTPEEYGKIQEHAAYTSEILEQIHFSRDLKNVPFIASAHHERMDGNGYPYGITGEDLPLSARILAIVDVYDALTAYDRPYKKAMPVEKALAILEQGRGNQFDAELVDLFISEKCHNIERRQHQRVSVDLKLEIVFPSNDDQKQYLDKFGPPRTGEGGMTGENEAEAFEGYRREEHSIRVKDISESGMQFETDYFFPIDNFVILNILIKSFDIEMLSRVVRIRHRPVGTGYIMGVEFVNLKSTDRARLMHYIDTLTPYEKMTPIRFY